MKCDVEMLRMYSTLWYQRFFDSNKYDLKLLQLKMSPDIQFRLTNNNNISPNQLQSITSTNNWLQFVNIISNAMELNKDINILTDITKFTEDDMILSAVDFHCSNMLDILYNDNGIAYQIIQNNINKLKHNNINGIDLFRKIVWEFRSSTSKKMGLIYKDFKSEELRFLYIKLRECINDFCVHYYDSRSK